MVDRAILVRLPDVLAWPEGRDGVLAERRPALGANPEASSWTASPQSMSAPRVFCVRRQLRLRGAAVALTAIGGLDYTGPCGSSVARPLTAGPSAPAPCAIQRGPRLALRGSPRASPRAREGSGSGAIPGPGCWSEDECDWDGAADGRTPRPRAWWRGPGDPTSGPRTAEQWETTRAAPRCTSRTEAHG